MGRYDETGTRYTYYGQIAKVRSENYTSELCGLLDLFGTWAELLVDVAHQNELDSYSHNGRGNHFNFPITFDKMPIFRKLS
jgi:hypothetical protein